MDNSTLGEREVHDNRSRQDLGKIWKLSRNGIYSDFLGKIINVLFINSETIYIHGSNFDFRIEFLTKKRRN